MQGQPKKGFEGSTNKRAKLGQWLFWLGLGVFFVESWLLIAQVADFWQGSGAASLGWLAALGATAQRVLSLLTWSQGMMLAAVAKVLVLCCPLVILLAGFVMMKSMAGGNGTSPSGTIEVDKQ